MTASCKTKAMMLSVKEYANTHLPPTYACYLNLWEDDPERDADFVIQSNIGNRKTPTYKDSRDWYLGCGIGATVIIDHMIKNAWINYCEVRYGG